MSRTSGFLFILIIAMPATTWARETLKVGYLPILDHLPLVVSHAREHDNLQAADVRLQQFRSWRSMVGALKAGQLDAVLILSSLAIHLSQTGTDLKTILLAHRNGSAIITRKGTGVRAARDLAGRTVAIPHRKATHTALLDHFLRGAGLSLADVSARVIAPGNMQEAMRLGKIDAFIVAEPFGMRAERDGVGQLLVLTGDLIKRHVECIVVARQQVLDEKPAAVQAWVDSLLRAGRFIERDRAEEGAATVAALARRYMGHEESLTRMALQNPADRILFTDLQPRVADFQPIVDISVRAGLIKPFDPGPFIADEFYRASPERQP